MPSPQFSIKALASLLFSTSVSAHMMMSQPMPYGQSSLNNSPLAADGSDFPCKQRSGVYDVESAKNVMAQGSTQPLTFIGSAVHGGGSCQVSLTTDLQPTKDSKWMVIKSIIGGCPADVTGNLPSGSATAVDPYSFTYTVPTDMPPGDYTIAWSWVNKVGNREFYMNCGPATITKSTKKRYAPNAPVSKAKRQSTYPDMFVANLAGINSCTTTEGIDIQYPDPGSEVSQSADANVGAPGAPSGSSCSPGGGNVAAAAPPAAGSSAPAAGSSATAAAAGTTAAPAASSASGGVFATGAASISSAAPPAATETVVPVPATSAGSPAPAASTAPASTPPTSTPPTSGSAVAGAACSPEGEWYCSADGTSYQRCASGVWSVPMQMAAGTACTPGMSSTLSEVVTNAKRASFHARRSHQAYARLSS